VLHGIPFHALYDGAGYAIDRWEVLYTPSAAVWLNAMRSARAERGSNAVVVGMPLPGIERVQFEAEQVNRVLPGSMLLLGERATVQNVKQAAGSAGLLHVAAHAQFRADNPLFSGLELSDGWLLAHDLYAMQLKCDLAVLSACYTGIGGLEAGDELFGMVRGFLSAGARSVAASFWAADDRVTEETMNVFYSKIADGCGPCTALTESQKVIRNSWPHPYYWAAFALIGAR